MLLGGAGISSASAARSTDSEIMPSAGGGSTQDDVEAVADRVEPLAQPVERPSRCSRIMPGRELVFGIVEAELAGMSAMPGQ